MEDRWGIGDWGLRIENWGIENGDAVGVLCTGSLGPCSGTRGRRERMVRRSSTAPSRKRRSLSRQIEVEVGVEVEVEVEVDKRKENRLSLSLSPLLSLSPSFSIPFFLYPLLSLSPSFSLSFCFSRPLSPYQVVCRKRRRGGGHLLFFRGLRKKRRKTRSRDREVSGMEKNKFNALHGRKALLPSSLQRLQYQG